MITLSNHSCYHCKHMHRKNRTRHGQLTEWLRREQKELQEALDSGNIDRVRFKKAKVDEVMLRLQQFERFDGTMEPWYNRQH